MPLSTAKSILPDFESEGREFESLRARHQNRFDIKNMSATTRKSLPNRVCIRCQKKPSIFNDFHPLPKFTCNADATSVRNLSYSTSFAVIAAIAALSASRASNK